MNAQPARKPVADLLYDMHEGAWMSRWTRLRNEPHAHRTLDLVVALLDGHEPVYAEVQVHDSGDESTFELVVLADDRIVFVSGKIDEAWPAAIVVPRRELGSLELREIPHEAERIGWSHAIGTQLGLSTDSAAVALEYPQRPVELPMSSSDRRGAAVAEFVPSLMRDRLAVFA